MESIGKLENQAGATGKVGEPQPGRYHRDGVPPVESRARWTWAMASGTAATATSAFLVFSALVSQFLYIPLQIYFKYVYLLSIKDTT